MKIVKILVVLIVDALHHLNISLGIALERRLALVKAVRGLPHSAVKAKDHIDVNKGAEFYHSVLFGLAHKAYAGVDDLFGIAIGSALGFVIEKVVKTTELNHH